MITYALLSEGGLLEGGAWEGTPLIASAVLPPAQGDAYSLPIA